MNSIFKRKSVRKYKEKEVENEKIERILRAGMAAPSAGNQQPWEFYVVKNKEVLEKLSKVSPYAGCTKDATVAIVTCYREDLRFTDYVQQDLSACTENILLQVEEEGLGAVWLGIAPLKERMDGIKEVLNLEDTIHPFSIIPIGYPLKEESAEDRYNEERIHYIE